MANDLKGGDKDTLVAAYRLFNARDIDAVLALMHPSVVWPNGMEGGYVHGREGVRAYWTQQWGMIDPHVEPLSTEIDAKGRTVVEVHQVVRDLNGNLLQDSVVHHAYTLRDGLIERMEIE
jgi:ketosteroid isomerase-like protein